MSNTPQDIFSYITTEETAYSLPVNVIDGYEWNMREHIRLSTLYKNSQYSTGKDDNKPYKNIIRPILNLQYRAEGFDVKDIELFINDSKQYFKSFLVRKFHEKWARDNDMDTFIDSLVESYVDYGGALVKKINKSVPEVVPLQSIAFCDQTDLLSGPIGIKHFFSPDQLMDMAEAGWGNTSKGATATLEEVIVLAEASKAPVGEAGKKNQTPGKYIEVYEVHGTLPTKYLTDEENEEQERYTSQLQIVTFYFDEQGDKKGIILYRGKEKKSPFKLLVRDKIYGRSLGFGGAEELFEPQVWVNYDIIRIKNMLDAASKVLYKTTDEAFANRNKTTELENGEILVLAENKDISQLNTQPVNLQVFENSIATWEQHAQQMGSANDSIMGKNPSSGTPFALQELVTEESHSLHNYRKGKISTFIDEIYRDWVIPGIITEITKGQKFLSELELGDLQAVADSLVTVETNNMVREMILNGELPQDEQVEMFKQDTRDQFMKGGNKRFIEIFEGEMKNTPIDVYTNIAGKQKDMAKHVDKLVNVFRQIISAPQILDDPRMAKIFNEILENSGLSPIDFYSKPKPQMMQQPMQEAPPAPQQAPQPLQIA